MAADLCLHLPEHFPREIDILAFGQAKRGAVQELRADMMEQGAVNPILERRGIAGLDGQRLGHFQQRRLHGVPHRFVGVPAQPVRAGPRIVGRGVDGLPPLAAQLLANHARDPTFVFPHGRIVFDPSNTSCQFSSGFGGGAMSPTSNSPSSINRWIDRRQHQSPGPVSQVPASAAAAAGLRSHRTGRQSERSVRFFALKMSHSH